MQVPFPFEVAFSQLLQSSASPLVTGFMILLTWLGSPVFWGGVILCLYWMHRRPMALRVLLALIIAGGVTEVLKYSVARLRPGIDYGIKPLYVDGMGKFGFPSGHAMLVSTQFSQMMTEKWVPPSFLGVGVLLVVLVGLSRVYLGVHYLLDVGVGIILGTLIGIILSKITHQALLIQKIRARQNELLIGLIGILGLGLFLVSPDSMIYAGAIFGFIAGFMLYEERSSHTPLPFTVPTVIRLGGGLLTTGWLAWEVYAQISLVPGYEIVSFAAFFLIGVYATLVYPLVWERFFDPFISKKR
ncbi:MAG: phosphatase PAP2 family protein [Candidatus Diapherotrites archaeon]|nr:phosphatase PAP2 family protein [Candidatus Diapherotrites archaeon]MDZ4256067.1 phosphatase PAP2 family protein [archaeon]